MKNERGYPKASITKKGEASLRAGHSWVYEAEIVSLSEEPENGGLVDILNEKGRYLGTGLFSLHSKIRIRLISRNANDKFDEAFWLRRLSYAWQYRKTVMRGDISCCRVIFGEADQFPGLTVDLFQDVLVTQTLSIGMERLKPLLFPLLFDLLRKDGIVLRGIYERNDVAIRDLEGLQQSKGWFPLAGAQKDFGPTQATIIENGIR